VFNQSADTKQRADALLMERLSERWIEAPGNQDKRQWLGEMYTTHHLISKQAKATRRARLVEAD